MNQLVRDPIADDIAAVLRIDVVPKILDVVCRTTGLGFAAVARVTSERWVACAVRDEISFGLAPGGELQVETTICNEIRGTGQAVVIDHADADELFSRHPTPAMYGFQSYISTPIYSRGEFFGTLCAIDPAPAKLRTPETISMFELFADLIGSHLDAEEQLARSQAALLDEREGAELREQFIAVLGHDLRNPLAALEGGARLLRQTPLNEKASWVLGQMQGSVDRMAGLIDNVMDFARGRLGGGFDVEKRTDGDLAKVLEQVVAELRTGYPDRLIEADITLSEPVAHDRRRMAQLASNLISNALVHGAAYAPVVVEASSADGAFLFSVANQGDPIPAEALPRLFQPFSRAAVLPSKQGLGLGLYIAAQIAQAHGGHLTAHSDAEETRFTFTMPLS